MTSTNLNIVESLMAYGFDAVTANPFVGLREGLAEAITGLHNKGGGVIFLVYMSHLGADEGYGLETLGGRPMYRLFAERARQWGADGVVVSAKSMDIMEETRNIVGKGCLIYAPGVGPQGGTVSMAAGADFVIVGRAITEDKDPAEVLRSMNRSLE
jgi:orotidine-5'-phosphate decarboxylase